MPPDHMETHLVEVDRETFERACAALDDAAAFAAGLRLGRDTERFDAALAATGRCGRPLANSSPTTPDLTHVYWVCSARLNIGTSEHRRV